MEAREIVERLEALHMETEQPQRLGLTKPRINRYLAVKIAAALTDQMQAAVWRAVGDEEEAHLA